jgi:hypothetical protein
MHMLLRREPTEAGPRLRNRVIPPVYHALRGANDCPRTPDPVLTETYSKRLHAPYSPPGDSETGCVIRLLIPFL